MTISGDLLASGDLTEHADPLKAYWTVRFAIPKSMIDTACFEIVARHYGWTPGTVDGNGDPVTAIDICKNRIYTFSKNDFIQAAMVAVDAQASAQKEALVAIVASIE